MAFKSVLYAPTEQELCEKFHTLTALTAFDDNARCGQYFDSLWACKEDWAFAYRAGLPLRRSNTTNYIEVAFRILKDCVFDRVMDGTHELNYYLAVIFSLRKLKRELELLVVVFRKLN